MICKIIHPTAYRVGKEEGIAALKEANLRCSEAIELLQNNPLIRYDTDTVADIAWKIEIPAIISCSIEDNADQIHFLDCYQSWLV